MKTKNIFLFIIPLLLTSCDFFNIKPSESSSSSISEDTSSSSIPSSSTSEESSISTSSSSEDTSIKGFSNIDMAFINKDLDSSYAPTIGEQTVLFVPVHLAGDPTYTWTLNTLNKYKNYGQDLTNYYTNASNGKIHNPVTMLATKTDDIYQAGESYTEDSFMGETFEEGYSHLLDLFQEIIDYYSSRIDLSNYDSDGDGFIDSIHFIVDGSDNNTWGSTLWPHMATTGFPKGTKNKPNVHAYSLSNLGHDSGAYTTIHEQGHIYGVQDYYDYSYSGMDLVGHFDMQSSNMGDWNAFSKLSAGWANAYVYNYEEEDCSITINPAGTSNDCIIVPTRDYNNSPFDEYILIELVTRVGNYTNDWYSDLGNGGIRVSHVDARLWGCDLTDIDDINKDSPHVTGGNFVKTLDNEYDYTFLAFSNSLGDEYPQCYIEEFEGRYHLYHVLQRGNVNTFQSGSRTYLTSGDLFKTNDTFTIGEHDGYTDYGPNFFANYDRLNSEELFNLGISFTNVGTQSATIRIKQL